MAEFMLEEHNFQLSVAAFLRCNLMRITGGRACGRPIAVPALRGVRPTGSKMRQALFNILGKKVANAEFLDLFAGSGLMGFEALSRGARFLTCVEKNIVCARCLEINAQKLGFLDKIKIIRADFRQAIAALSGQRFDIIFADPPYKSDFGCLILDLIAENNLLQDKGILVIEHQKNLEFDTEENGLSLIECRPYSQSAFSFFAPA